MRLLLPLLVTISLALVACQPRTSYTSDIVPTDTPSAPAPMQIDGTPAEIASTLIALERTAAMENGSQQLEAIWATDARIIDGRNTSRTDDDYIWQGRDAILDRYHLAVFASPPPPLSEEELQSLHIVSADDSSITAELGVDEWTLLRHQNGWLLYELRYNQPEQ